MVKGDTGPPPGHWAIKGADAQTGMMKTYWDGPRASRYAPMKKQGAMSARPQPSLCALYARARFVLHKTVRVPAAQHPRDWG